MKLAADNDSRSLILHCARRFNKPTLVGLKEGAAVIKPLEPGDEGLSFETLYDTAITARDFKRMAKYKVSSPEELPLPLWRVRCGITNLPVISPYLKAENRADIPSRLHKLVRDENFLVELVDRIIKLWLKEMTGPEDGVVFEEQAYRVTDNPPPDSPEWSFVETGSQDPAEDEQDR
jgi:hypothetical protein